MPNEGSKWNRLKSSILGQRESEMFNEIQVNSCTLDHFFQGKEELIYLLKIDVEGAELEVIRGAKHLLAKGLIKQIQFEQHENDMRPNFSNEIDNLLKSFGYIRKHRIRHAFGKFYENIYVINID